MENNCTSLQLTCISIVVTLPLLWGRFHYVFVFGNDMHCCQLDILHFWIGDSSHQFCHGIFWSLVHGLTFVNLGDCQCARWLPVFVLICYVNALLALRWEIIVMIMEWKMIDEIHSSCINLWLRQCDHVLSIVLFCMLQGFFFFWWFLGRINTSRLNLFFLTWCTNAARHPTCTTWSYVAC